MIVAGVEMLLRALKPDLQRFVAPPGVSFLTLVRPPSSHGIPKFRRRVPSGFIAAADKNLVLLCVGTYRPGSSNSGSYLLCDTASSSPSPIPGVNSKHSFKCPGYAAVIAAREGGGFLLAELLLEFLRPQMPATGMLCLWQGKGSEWAYKFGQLPAEVSYPWKVHTSFYVQGKKNLFFCWVNLLSGLILCDIGRHCEEVDSASFDTSFVPLPSDCSISQERGLNYPQDFRTMTCVDGTIKFLTMEGTPISLVTYTLEDLDGPSPWWKKDTVMLLGDLWADDTFISTGLPPQITPLFPNLSTQEHDVVYLVMPGKVECEEEDCLIWRPQLLLSVDTRKIKVISVSKVNCAESLFSLRYVLPFTFTGSQQLGLKYHQAQQLQANNNGSETASNNNYTRQKTQRAVEAIGMGQVEKKMKFE